MELFCCQWVIESKCLHKVVLNDCGIKGSSFLSQLLQRDIGIEEIVLDNGVFTSALSFDGPILVKELSVLSLRSCKCNSDFLLSLLIVIRENNISIHSLDFSQMEISDNDFTSFLLALTSIHFPSLESFYFDDNTLDSNQTILLTTFLEKQPQLQRLSLNSSINVYDSPNGFFAFSKYITGRTFTHLSLRNDKSINYSFGHLLFPILKSQQNTLVYLDVTNQGIGQDGIELILPSVLNGTINRLFFDGSNISSFDYLCKFCTTLVSTQMKIASFPRNDFERLSKHLITNESDIDGMIETMKSKFETKFGKNSIDSNYIPQIKRSQIKTIVRTDSNKTNVKKVMSRANSTSVINEMYERLVDYDIEKMLMQYGIEYESDPIYGMLAEIEEELSIDELTRKLVNE
ncbi:Leucine Rich Repeat family protein [Histomonas meleagridis]|uniref:Leucine Rich Repeat family protein n=1 Tax=Histomonas meleagridis TaxID=135588 RepID=UPI00355A5650|nr:Leucine Rich Repeat family protein [Histomonas meleagridis]KAH0796273.1 Leucine Rich Repeat family protein [Histomonas meleagridis]